MIMVMMSVLRRFEGALRSTETVVGHAQLHSFSGGGVLRLAGTAAAEERPGRSRAQRGGVVGGREPRRPSSAAAGRPSTAAACVQQGDERLTELRPGGQVQEHIARVVRQADLAYTHSGITRQQS